MVQKYLTIFKGIMNPKFFSKMENYYSHGLEVAVLLSVHIFGGATQHY